MHHWPNGIYYFVKCNNYSYTRTEQESLEEEKIYSVLSHVWHLTYDSSNNQAPFFSWRFVTAHLENESQPKNQCKSLNHLWLFCSVLFIDLFSF